MCFIEVDIDALQLKIRVSLVSSIGIDAMLVAACLSPNPRSADMSVPFLSPRGERQGLSRPFQRERHSSSNHQSSLASFVTSYSQPIVLHSTMCWLGLPELRSFARGLFYGPRSLPSCFSLPFSSASMSTSSETRTSQNLEPTWLPHWPPWMCTISRMAAWTRAKLRRCDDRIDPATDVRRTSARPQDVRTGRGRGRASRCPGSKGILSIEGLTRNRISGDHGRGLVGRCSNFKRGERWL